MPKLRQLLESALPEPLIAIDEAGLARWLSVFTEDRSLDGNDLLLEIARLGCGDRLFLRPYAELVEFLPRDSAVLANSHHGLELVEGHVEGEIRGNEETATLAHILAQTNVAHHLQAAADAHIDAAGLDKGVDHVERLLGGSALAVHGRTRHLVMVPLHQPRKPCVVAGLFTGLGHGSADHLLDVPPVDAGTLDHSVQGNRQNFCGVKSTEPSLYRVAPCDRCPTGLNNHCFSHERSPLWLQ